ncbi:hypothetical protein [Streptomyces sp. H27-D2]|uniref:hypothetical protein n=1 Tax=Streptomyces sp. H27-D2 TaxID=3046304 RepID=UPI002DBCFD2B|nr:hypothetical protein [Streptomyces sp. H27-D2]MEC4014769.1 hypothetical protein [Streptomyces sp. H27-D2]
MASPTLDRNGLQMKFVKVEWNSEFHGFRTDARDYLSELPNLRDGLPSNAWEFASDDAHYDYGSERCIKDLELSEITVPENGNGVLALRFSPNKWKHTAGLRIEYTGVSHFSIDYEGEIDWMDAYTTLLDEILPHNGGCLHEIALSDASITVHCADLKARWEGPGV